MATPEPRCSCCYAQRKPHGPEAHGDGTETECSALFYSSSSFIVLTSYVLYVVQLTVRTLYRTAYCTAYSQYSTVQYVVSIIRIILSYPGTVACLMYV